jgi:Tfp pilus assembly protein PilX
MTRVIPSRLRNDRGFALPTVILLIALLTILLTSGLSRARTERQIAEATDETATAFTIAQGGLQTYLGTTTSPPPDGDSTRVNETGGYANVVVNLVRNPADTTERLLYLIRSTGVVINPDSGARAQATHTVAQFAEWETGKVLPRAALTAANSIRKRNGTAALSFSGNDACGVNAPIPGVVTTTLTGPPYPAPTFQGSPGLLEEGASAGPTVAAQTLINWAGALGGDLTPDYTSFRQGDFGYPIVRVAGDLTVSGIKFSSGILVVPGDFDIEGSFFYFEGIILVGGKIEFGSSFTQVRGLVVSGLNEQLGVNPQRTEIGGDGNNLFLYYDSCKVKTAMQPLTGLAPVRNAWMDNWASY